MDKIWLKNYPGSVNPTIEQLPYGSLPELFDAVVTDNSNAPAFTNFDYTISYKELSGLVNKFAAYLTSILKLQKGERFALMLPNLLQYPIAMLAALKAGLVVVNINPLYTSRELCLQLKDSLATTILIWGPATYHFKQIYKDTVVKNIIVTNIGDCIPWPKSWLLNLAASHKAQFKSCKIKNAIAFKDALFQGAHCAFIKPKLELEDLAYLQYTGGTTGVSKGAMLTHKNILFNIEQAYAWFSALLTAKQEIVITALPLYHIFSLTANCWLFLRLGGHNVLVTNPRNLNSLIKILKKNRYTIMTGVNTLFNALLEHPKFASLDFSQVKIFFAGGMSLQQSIAKKWHKVTKLPLIEGYGLTETSPAAIINKVDNHKYNGSIGFPLPSTEIKIIDKQGKELEENLPGELCIRGPQVMLGYWHNLAETDLVLDENKWLKTGDIATINEQGLVFIIDRKKDIIIVSGFNVYPNEIEEVYVNHPLILEAGAIGIPDKVKGQNIKLFVVTKDKLLTCHELINYGKKYLAAYKVPSFIEFKSELPKSVIGKVLRKELR